MNMRFFNAHNAASELLHTHTAWNCSCFCHFLCFFWRYPVTFLCYPPPPTKTHLCSFQRSIRAQIMLQTSTFIPIPYLLVLVRTKHCIDDGDVSSCGVVGKGTP